MKPKNLIPTSVAVLCAFGVLSTRVRANAIAYTVTDLGTLGGSNSYGRAINASGQITGYSEFTGASVVLRN